MKSNVAIVIGWAGVIVSGFVVTGSFVTSCRAYSNIMGEGTGEFLVKLMPYAFSLLVLCFSALSSFFFKMYVRKGFTAFSFVVTFVFWVGSLAFDGVSSYMGVLSMYSTVTVSSWETMLQAQSKLSTLGNFFALVTSIIFSFGAFLLTLFSELLATTDSFDQDNQFFK